MIKANTTVIVGGVEYHEGQTVEGLSEIDIGWMTKAGLVSEAKDKESRRGKKSEPVAEAGVADEL